MPVSPRKLAANRANLAKRGPLTPAGRERLRQSALWARPWAHATGPKSATGKAKAAKNATVHGQETAERREWRRNALRLIRLDTQLRHGMVGKPLVGNLAEKIAEIVRLAELVAASQPVKRPSGDALGHQ